MRRVWLLLVVGLLGLGMLAACDSAEEITEPPGGGGDAGVPDEIALARSISPVLANGVDGVDIFVTVVDGNRRALADVGVSFSTTVGTIEPFATTNSAGVAETRFTGVAGDLDLKAMITAATSTDTGDTTATAPVPENSFLLLTREPVSPELIGLAASLARDESLPGVTRTAKDITDQVEVSLIGITLTLDASPETLPADGASTSQVKATLVETTNRIPLAGQEVRFGATSGSITGRVMTDDAGAATAQLTSTEGGSTSTVTAFYGNTIKAEQEVTFSSLRLIVGAGLPGIESDGSFVTPVTALLVNVENNPVAGALVEFATDAGIITSPGTTGADGTASVVLRTHASVTQANVTASFGDLDEILPITFGTPKFTVTAGTPSILADGNSSTSITAFLTTADDQPLAGVRVAFTTTLGTVSPSAVTGEDGLATATLVSGSEPGQAEVTASYATGRTAAAMVEFVSAPVPSTLVLTAEGSSVLADGLASTVLTATVTDNFGSPAPAGTQVSFTTTRGVLDNVLPTNDQGVATARLTATRFQTGLARVTARFEGLQDTDDVKFVSASAAQIVVADVSRQQIGVKGSGALETSVITYQVRDANGIPVDTDHSATLTFTVVPVVGEVDATVSPSSAATNEDGAVVATVQSGILSGALELEAVSGDLVSRPIRIAVHGGLPDPDHFSLSFERINIEGLVKDGIYNGVTARVGDEHGNPVPLQTAVWFEADYGIVQGSAFTDDHGEATVWEVTAGPHPLIPDGDGLVLITAQTVSAAGDRITTSGNVMWSGHSVAVVNSPDVGFVVENGGSIQILFSVADANGNPLTGGTQISVSSNRGELGGTTDFKMPDTQQRGPGFTSFVTILSDSDADESLQESVTVTITVTSENGNREVSRTGTIN